MPKSTATCNSILALMYNATAWANVADNASSSPLANIYVALHTATPTAGSDAQNESEGTIYTNYLRVAKARTTSGWTAPSGGATENEGQIQFAQCGASGATITSVSTGTDSSGVGHKWHFGDLNSPLTVANGITPQFADGALVITES